MSDLPDLIDRLGVAALDARNAVRECHEATRDLRTAMKDAEVLYRRLASEAIRSKVDEELAVVVKQELENLHVGMEKVEKGIYRRFDKISDILLGTEKKDQRSGEPSLADLARRAKKGGGAA